MNSLLFLAVAAHGLPQLLIAFLIMVLVLVIVGALIWCIEKYISPIPSPAKMVIALVLVIGVVIWAVAQFYPGAF